MLEDKRDEVVEETPKPKKKKKPLSIFDVQHLLHEAVVKHKQCPCEDCEKEVKKYVKALHHRLK